MWTTPSSWRSSPTRTRPLTVALARTAGDTELGHRAAEEALITALTRWKQVARTAAPIGWCYLRGLEELRAAGVDLPDEDRTVLATGEPAVAAQRLDDLQTPSTPTVPRTDAEGLVDQARRRRSLQTLVGMVVALGGVVVVAMLLAWLQSPGTWPHDRASAKPVTTVPPWTPTVRASPARTTSRQRSEPTCSTTAATRSTRRSPPT